jgi:pimeloyl-ACP methyl ester carboxylesterase
MHFPWLDKNEYPFDSHSYQINGYNLHYIDEGKGEIILFVHGTPSWSFDFRHAVKALRGQYRCIAIDHIGFGLSDKPKEYDYSTLNHSNTLEQFILQLGLNDITLVVHDFGGPIGLHVAIQHPELFKRIVILNSWMWSTLTDPDFIKMKKILKSPLLPFLYRHLNFSPKFILPKSFGDKKISKKILTQYTKPFANASQRNGALAFARSLLLDQNWFESLWGKRHRIQHLTVLLIWGMKDPVIRALQLEKFISGFPHANVVKLETCGHFPQEEDPERVNVALSQFLTFAK